VNAQRTEWLIVRARAGATIHGCLLHSASSPRPPWPHFYFAGRPGRKSKSIVDQAVEAHTQAGLFRRSQRANMRLRSRRPGGVPRFRQPTPYQSVSTGSQWPLNDARCAGPDRPEPEIDNASRRPKTRPLTSMRAIVPVTETTKRPTCDKLSMRGCAQIATATWDDRDFPWGEPPLVAMLFTERAETSAGR
jgi:hypothetical protein